MAKRGKSSGIRNSDRKCGKAWKKIKKKQRKTGRTIGGYSPAKLKIREYKRQNPIEFDSEVLADE
jgi:hypothetical protein